MPKSKPETQEEKWNRIAKLEKAIKDKYGESATINPASLWTEAKERDYIEQLKKQTSQEIQETPNETEINGFYIAKRLITKETSRECPICGEFSFHIRDDVFMQKYECCYKCYIIHHEGERSKTKKEDKIK